MEEALLQGIGKTKRKTKHFRLTENGVFISENVVYPLALNAVSDGGVHTERVSEFTGEIKSAARGELKYLYEARPELTMIGYDVPLKNFDSPSLQEILQTDGRTYSCRNYLLVTDPMFQRVRHFKLYPNTDFVGEFKTKHGIYLVERHAFHNFVIRARESRILNGGTSEKFQNLRDSLPVMYDMFNKSEEVERKNRIHQLVKYGGEDATYRAENGWIFVITSNGNVLKTCYEKGDLISRDYMRKDHPLMTASGLNRATNWPMPSSSETRATSLMSL